MRPIYTIYTILCFIFTSSCIAQQASKPPTSTILPGAYSINEYLPLLQNKKVALLVNQTSEINRVPLPDTLLNLKVNIVKIFSPEHGFRGNADAGATVKNEIDIKTGLPIISLYGKNKKPTKEQLKDVDIVVYDIQDVGARFYTYISTLQYMMEACAENNKTLIILDRPNPFGNIVDGPILEPQFMSFVGMQPIPIIYGMTPGEYAQMLKGEHWVKANNLNLIIIKCRNYTHNSQYILPVAPSPNLQNMAAIYLYPSLCLFEGTNVSVGRGTDYPFQQYGSPFLNHYTYSFTPKPSKGASQPLHNNEKCYGELLTTTDSTAIQMIKGKFQLKWLIKAYKNSSKKDQFFNSFFDKLAGNATLKKQIISGLDEATIRASWQTGLNQFKSIRNKYLLYK